MSSKIRIKNLPFETERSAVHDLLTMVGDVLTLRVAFEHGDTTAYVQMTSPDHAKNCVERLNRHRFRGHVLAVHEDTQIAKPRTAVVR